MSQSDSPEVAADYGEFVPFTARLMAAMRACESARDDRLFQDPFAAELAGEAALQRLEHLPVRDQAYVAVRTRFFDDFLTLTPTPQVVILAAGLDTRAYRIAWASGVKLYELDRAEVLTHKASLLQSVHPTCEHHLIAADLTQSWEDDLLAAGYVAEQPSVWLVEGLLMYLSEAQVEGLLSSVAQLTAPGSRLGLDLVNLKGLDHEPYRGYFRFGCDHPEEWLSRFGWQVEVTQPGDDDANFGRYPWVFPPREVAEVARAFLVKAQK